MAELVLRWAGGSLDLMGWNVGDDGTEFEIRSLAEGTDWGNPESVRRTLRSSLADGSVSVKDRDGNRTIPLRMRVTAANGDGLSAGEAALHRLDGVRCELEWTPPAKSAPTAVFVAVGATLRHEMDDAQELKVARFYTLTLDALPHAYSKDWVTIPALSSAIATPVLVDACTSATGWSSSHGALTVVSGGLALPPSASPVLATRNGTIDLTAHPYLVVRSQYPGEILSAAVTTSSGRTVLPKVGYDGTGVVFDASALVDPVVTQTRIGFRQVGLGYASLVRIDKMDQPRSTTDRATLQTLTVPGSARTPGSLVVESLNDDPLRDVIVYTGPEYDPSFMSGVLPDEPTVVPMDYNLSGRQVSLGHGDSLISYRAASEFPEGDYAFWARARSSVAGPVGGQLAARAQLWAGGSKVVDKIVSRWLVLPSNDYKMHLLGSATLPPGTLPKGADLELRFVLEWAASDENTGCYVDDVLFFNRTAGSLTIVKGIVAKRVRLDAATLEVDRPAVYLGGSVESRDFPIHMGNHIEAWDGGHTMAPPMTHIYTGTPGYNASANVQTTGRLRAAAHTHPAS